GVLGTLLECPDQWSTAGRLHDHHLRALAADPSKLPKLREGLPHPDDPGATSGRKDDHVREALIAPAALLRQLESKGLLPFLPVGLLQRVQFEPPGPGRTLVQHPASLVDQ